MMKPAANSSAWALGRQWRNGFHIRKICWGLLMAQCERRDSEEIRACTVTIEANYKPRRDVAPELTRSDPIIFIHPNIELNRQRHSVSREGNEVPLSPSQFLILKSVALARATGIPMAELFDLVYAGTDAPITGSKALQCQRCVINRKIKPLRLSISGPGTGSRFGTYGLAVQ